MKNVIITLIVLLISTISCFCQTRRYSFNNEYANWRGRTDYFNWKIYIQGDSSFLASIRQIEYYLDPSFRNPKRIVTRANGGKNFTLCTNGWGEFTIKIKIVFRNPTSRSINTLYRLDLESRARRRTNYACP